ncbi:MAG: ATP-binding protein [Pseudobutyrivibrio sp.]|nr:ATP-binding protein [Pseudobutyrivibrio sp.]
MRRYEDNPFSTVFGSKPELFVLSPGDNVVENVTNRLKRDKTSENVFMLYGTRGTGKTVTLSAIEENIEKDDRFIVVDLNSKGLLMEELVAKLYDLSQYDYLRKFFSTSINLSAFGIGINLAAIPPAASLEAAFIKILDIIKSKNHRLLIVIDEASKTKEMMKFAATFNLASRKGYPVYMLMTGLPDNISKLEDVEDLTFLRRAEHINMQPLNRSIMLYEYMDVLDIRDTEAVKLVNLTKGYPYAYQVLGKLLWDEPVRELSDKVIRDFDLYMACNVYDKLWESLSGKERWYLCHMANIEKDIIDVKELLGLLLEQHSNFSRYRESLIKAGILRSEDRGKIEFALPRFGNFVKRQMLLFSLNAGNNYGLNG